MYQTREASEEALFSANVPKRFLDSSAYKTLDRSALEIPERWLNEFSMHSLSVCPKNGLIILGELSESLMVELLKRIYCRRRKIFCINAEDVDRICRSNFYADQDGDTFDFLTERVHCVGIYGFPISSSPPKFGGLTYLDRLIIRRWEMSMPVIISSWLNMEDFSAILSNVDQIRMTVRALLDFEVVII